MFIPSDCSDSRHQSKFYAIINLVHYRPLQIIVRSLQYNLLLNQILLLAPALNKINELYFHRFFAIISQA